ncbi:MAG: hypothetical protein EOM91_16540 [Sphingobacteriia bacterium]|nr:hypothetical protein [Sphingobacteriia bacterium]NCC38117.1 hypothetical protein [Gammaproteobacteria bacterium]
MRYLFGLLALVVAFQARAAIPATPVMTLYQFNGPLEIPYYDADRFARAGATSPAGTLTQGTSVIPCLVIRNGKPLTDDSGTPFVGFEVIVDPRKATRAETERFKRAVSERRSQTVRNHHCPSSVKHVVNVRNLYALSKAPFFDPPGGGRGGQPEGASELDRIVRAFHASPQCEEANRRLVGRRDALDRAWSDFIRSNARLGGASTLNRAKHLDYSMRTAIYEGHLERGCNAYGACERNIVLLSIRNRAEGQCLSRQGCKFPGDFQGVSSAVSQYNIWDEYLTQISGLTACYLRPDLANQDYYAKIQTMYQQTVGDAERILFGSERDIQALFPDNRLADLTALRHYYHAPAMGKCFPTHTRVEYMTGAVARNGDDFALIANTRIKVGAASGDGYRFEEFRFDETPRRDVIRIEDNYPGFIVDGRKVSLRQPRACPPYGIPSGCASSDVGRYRTTPSWLSAGRPIEIMCRIQDRGESCRDSARTQTARVGGVCDKEMRPVAGVE